MEMQQDPEEPKLFLYRGDFVPQEARNSPNRNRTFAAHFCDIGLIARSLSGKIPKSMFYDLLNQVPAHIGYMPGSKEEELARCSPLISFSENLECAFQFMVGTKGPNLTECRGLREATHFIWLLRLRRSYFQLLPRDRPQYEGCFWFRYRASSVNVRKQNERRLTQALNAEAHTGDLQELVEASGELVAANNADMDSRDHFAIIINASTFIERNCVGNPLYKRALSLAQRHREWLLYPCDTGEDGWPSGKFVMNEHLLPFRWYRITPGT
jgi:hypothetical protein